MGFPTLCARLLLHSLAVYAATVSQITPRSEDGAQVESELSPLLSDGASITLSSSSSWDQLVERASTPRVTPQFVAVVEVATEEDVQQTIKVANKLKLPFLAVSGTHGWPSTLNNVENGIQINMRRMNQTQVHPDGTVATAGGGTMQYEMTSALLEHNKQAVIGICECVSAIGPLLGGGHSMLQGRHGFAADNLVSARVVLADGKAVTASEDENPDLFWAIRGAGHNFGIVTSFDLNVYDVAKRGWIMTTFTFTQDKLEDFFDTWNQLEAENDDPGMLVLNGVMNRNDTTDPDYPLINLQLLYEGEDTAADVYAEAFRKLGPVADSTVPNIAWGDLFDVGGFGLESPVCRKNENILGLPNSFAKWDGTAMRRGFELFAELTSDETFSTGAWLVESYGRKGVQGVPESANAVAPEERRRHLLTSPMLWWKGTDKDDRKKATHYGQKIQEAIRNDGFVPHSYVNYAKGGEELGEMYGREADRLQKLKQLKKAWDPHNRFGFYSPIQ